MRQFYRSKCLPVSALVVVLLVTATSAQSQGDTPTIQDFQKRVNRYVSLKNKQDLSNKQSSSPDQLAEQKQQAAEKLQSARPTAQQGDIFTAAISAYFKRQIAGVMQGAGGKKIRASMRHAEPLPTIHLEVNATYPKNLPLQSTPPTLLMSLPPLPKGLQYRVVGSSLVLFDESSNLIVDFIPNAIEIV